MASNLDKAAKKTAVAEIERYGEKLLIPDGMSLKKAIMVINERMEYEEQVTVVRATYDCFPWDGAVALNHVLTEKYGWGRQVSVETMFGESPPALIEVQCGPNEVVNVPWGRFQLPNIEGYVETDMIDAPNGRKQFMLVANIKRKSEATVRDLFQLVRDRIKVHSIYRGKAIRIEFKDSAGEMIAIPTPVFLDTAKTNPEDLVLNRDLEMAIAASLYTPIERAQDCLDNGISVKRGVLLGGTFGTGKTMVANICAKKAVDAGMTFIMIKDASELASAIEFARQYQSPAAGVFCEDIDREMAGERDGATDEARRIDAILNTIDGIESKNTNIIVVLTTNAIEKIHQAMLRPGRIDAVINFVSPDAEAVQRLIRKVAGTAVDSSADLSAVGEVLAGAIPAVITEVVKRAKLVQLSLQQRGTRVERLSAEALMNAALSIQAQIELLKPKSVNDTPALVDAMQAVVRGALNGHAEEVSETLQMARKIDNGLKRVSSSYRN